MKRYVAYHTFSGGYGGSDELLETDSLDAAKNCSHCNEIYDKKDDIWHKLHHDFDYSPVWEIVIPKMRSFEFIDTEVQ